VSIKMPDGRDFAAKDVAKHAITIIAQLPDDADKRGLADLARENPGVFAVLVNAAADGELVAVTRYH
jgi:hypothetical protein